MTFSFAAAAASAIVGLLVGSSGAGGGALLTPVLTLALGLSPTAVIPSELVAALFMRPVGAIIHLRRRTVNKSIIAWLSLGSVPAAIVGAGIFHIVVTRTDGHQILRIVLAVTLISCAVAMLARVLLKTKLFPVQSGVTPLTNRSRNIAIAIGFLAGLLVGATSAGSGSVVIVLLAVAFPAIGASDLVGIDLVQAIPLTLAAVLGQVMFGHVQFGLSASIAAGGIPGVAVGALVSTYLPDRPLRYLIALTVLGSGMAYAGIPVLGIGLIVTFILIGLLLVQQRSAVSVEGQMVGNGDMRHEENDVDVDNEDCLEVADSMTNQQARCATLTSHEE